MPWRRCHSQSHSSAAQPARGAGAHVGRDQDAEVKSLTIGFPGKKLSWQPLSLDILGEREEVSQTAGTKTRKMTWEEGETQKTQRPRKERIVEPETEK